MGRCDRKHNFLETTSGNSADITIAATDIDGYGRIYGYRNYIWDSNEYITEGTIRFDSYDLDNGWILTTAMHEIGNILGLGDLRVSSQYTSVQEDPFPQKYNGNQLWEFDQQMINTLYPSTIKPEPTPEPTPEPQPEPTPVSFSFKFNKETGHLLIDEGSTEIPESSFRGASEVKSVYPDSVTSIGNSAFLAPA